jgi:hypothetical protein
LPNYNRSQSTVRKANVESQQTIFLDVLVSSGQRDIHHLLRVGSSPEAVVIRRDGSWRVFGAKAISWLESPDDEALNSRCIQIPMTETTRDLVSLSDPGTELAAKLLQSQLLHFRFQAYNNIKVPQISEKLLRPRLRDLVATLAAPCGDDKNFGER